MTLAIDGDMDISVSKKSFRLVFMLSQSCRFLYRLDGS